MRRTLILLGWLLAALIALPVGAAHAQGDLGADEQAALASARQAVADFFALDTYVTEHTQTLDQTIRVNLGAQAITIDQQIHQRGTTLTERQPESAHDNAASALDQTLTQTLSDGQNEQSLAVDQTVEMVVLDDRAYLRISTADPQLASFYPEGWKDVTEGAGAFPGMELYDIDQLLSLSSTTFSAAMFDAFFDAVSDVETLAPETLDGMAVQRVHLVLDSAAALSGENARALSAIFSPGSLPLDASGILDLIFSDEDTRFEITLLLGADDGLLYGYDVRMNIDIDIPAGLLTDPSLAGAELSLTQESASALRFTNQNEPVVITAPALEE